MRSASALPRPPRPAAPGTRTSCLKHSAAAAAVVAGALPGTAGASCWMEEVCLLHVACQGGPRSAW